MYKYDYNIEGFVIKNYCQKTFKWEFMTILGKEAVDAMPG